MSHPSISNDRKPTITQMENLKLDTPFTIGSLPERFRNLTSVQHSFLDKTWEHFHETGKPFSKRALPRIIGKHSVEKVFEDADYNLVTEVFEQGEKGYLLTGYGALLTKQGNFLATLFIRLLDLIKQLYENDHQIKQIDSLQITSMLALSADETRQIFSLLQLRTFPNFPFYLSSYQQDGSEWSITANDEVIELYSADNSTSYLDSRLGLGSISQQKKLSAGHIYPFETNTQSDEISASSFLSLIRITELKGFSHTDHDFTRLICLCEELNDNATRNNPHAVIMLTRAILDHVPPVFGFDTFTMVASNYAGGGSSFKKSMERLENQARKVADRFLHTKIRKKETTPTMQEVNFAQELETMLSELCRILK